MSKIITYAFFGEDEAQRNFLEKYLNQQYPNTFIEDENERWRFKAGNGKQVDSLLPEALRQRALLGLDVLFVGRDIDTEHKPIIAIRQNHYAGKCKDHPAVLMLPVQCIEYWLWYIKRHSEEPGKNTPLEPQPRSSAKQAVYAGTKVAAKQVEIANDILVHLDVEWLEQRSESFKHFHKQITAFLNEYNKT
ncbi:hypothetical protein DYU11_25815 [Fibrisoma montanum]|uniref:Uncharacterized protein n=1 Tax=Fibrisoma montanum TaxID=2305895 RepID=A0A418LZS3_9BACT|nr:hypothetical protein [Fibrisoma montanum]RIV18921.1 hypothetical protein DYU11_25815 [Fibrisoma montanum]